MARPEGPPQSGNFEQRINVGKENFGGERQREKERLRLIAETLVRRHGYETVVSAVAEAFEAIEKEGTQETELLTLQEVAEFAGVAKATVHDWLTDGKLKPRKYDLYVGSEVFRPLLDKQDVVDFLQNKRRPGRPKRQPK